MSMLLTSILSSLSDFLVTVIGALL